MSMYHSVSCLESEKKFSDFIIFLTNFDDFSNRMKQVALVVLDWKYFCLVHVISQYRMQIIIKEPIENAPLLAGYK